MTNIDEIKYKVKTMLAHDPRMINQEWAATTILELCGEVERLKSELAEKDSVLEVYANNSTTVWDCNGVSVITDNLMAQEVLQKYRGKE